VRRRSSFTRLVYLFERAITFDPTVGSPSNFYTSFRTLVFLAVDFETLLGEEEV
jgi:hypothetical protein